METPAQRFVDAVIADGFLPQAEGLLDTLRHPPGRRPAASSKFVAEALAGLTDEAALPIVRSVLDAAVFSVLAFVDQGCKDRGLTVTVASGENIWINDGKTSGLIDRYRERVDPDGIIRTLP